MPHGPDRVPKMRVHENLYTLPECSLLTLANLSHVVTELAGTQTEILQAETQDICLHGSQVNSEQVRIAVEKS